MEQMTNTSYWSRNYILICLCNLLVFLSFQMILPTLPVYLADNGIDKTIIGLTTGIITIAAVLIRPFIGYALDHFNRRLIVSIGSIVFTLSSLAFTLSEQIGWTIFASVLLGLGWGIMTVFYQTIVSEVIPSNQQGAGIGTFMLFALISMSIAPFLGGWLISTYEPQFLFGTAFLIALISSVISFFVGIQKKVQHVPEEGEDQSFLSMIFDRSSLLPGLLILLFTVGYGGIISFVNLFGLELGIENAAIFFVLSYLAAILVRPLAGKAFDTKGHAYVLIPGVLVGILSLIVLSMATNWSIFITAGILYGLSFGSVQPYIMAWTVQRASPERRGAANSTFLVGMDGGIALGSIILGYISNAVGYASMYGYSSLFLVVLLLIYVVSQMKGKETAK